MTRPLDPRAAILAAFLVGLGAACGGGGGSGPPPTDTDGDGLSDAAEATAGTNPNDPDTDDDGLQDGAEVTAGSNPLVADTDADGIADGAEVAAGTNPTLPDTDADGIADGAEAGYGTSPILADTDDDGLGDGDEIALGYDPTDPDDPPDTTDVCDLLAACARDSLVPVRWVDRAQGDFRLALPEDAVTGGLSFPDVPPDTRVAAVGFDVAADLVAGFVLSMDEPVADGDPTAQLNELYTRLSAASGAAPAPWTATELVAGRTLTSWDGFPAVVGARVNLTRAAAANLGTMRSGVLGAMTELSGFTGLPAGAFGSDTEFVVSLQVLTRRKSVADDAHRIVVVAAVAPKTAFDDRALTAKILSGDLAGGTSLGQSGDGESTNCDPFDVTSEPRADFVWMSDVSGSTSDERIPIQNSTAAVFARLLELGIDFRMGVVRHTANSVTLEEPAGRLISPGFTNVQATFAGYWGDPGSDLGREYGLTAVDDVVNPTTGTAMPRTLDGTDGAGNATRLRQDVKVVAIYVSDEHAEEVEVACPEIANNNKNLASGTVNSRAQCIDTTVQPFIDTLASPEVDAIAFGIIAEPPGGCTTSLEVGWGYSRVIEARGGTYGSVCASDPGQTLQDIVDAVAGAASSFQLEGDPIAITLKVIVTPAGATCDPANPSAGRIEVPRSQMDGFDYDPVNNSIFFVGASRPDLGDTVTVSYREWVDGNTSTNPDPGGCTDCGGCPGGSTCEVATCTCVPIG